MNELLAPASVAGDRLDVVLAAHLGISRSRAAARIAAGDVTVDGKPSTKHHRVRAGEHIEIAAPAPIERPDAPPVPPIRYEDKHLLVVAKPAGMVVHPGPGHASGTLVDALAAAGHELAPAAGDGRPGIVHRLDRDTSGLLVVARTDVAYAGLVAALQHRDVSRRYLALVSGVPGADRGRIEAPIGRDPRDRKRFAVVTDGKPAVTRYVSLARGTVPDVPPHRATVSLLACRLESGRTHQIRVHLTTLGHPVVGDPTYGRRADVAAGLGLTRPFLHAAALAFDHPVTGTRVAVEEPLPDELVAALEAAGIAPPGPLGDPEEPERTSS